MNEDIYVFNKFIIMKARNVITVTVIKNKDNYPMTDYNS